MFSERTNWPLGLNKLANGLKQRRDAGLPVLDLTVSNPTACGIPYPRDEIQAALTGAQILRYQPDPKGALSAREAVVAYYGARNEHIDPERLILTASTSEAYSFLFRLLTNPGDEVLIPQPSYPLFDFLADINDVVLKRYPLCRDRNWRIDHDVLLAEIGSKTRAILAVNPNNPTGSYLHVEDRNFLFELCVNRNLALIVDEVFFDYAIDPSSVPPPWPQQSDALVFRLNGLSKTLGLPQLKLGWIQVAGPRKEREEALARLEIVADTFLSVNTPVQAALPQLFKLRKRIQDAIRQRVALNWGYLLEAAKNIPELTLFPPQGGWTATLEFPCTYCDEEWALRFLEKHGVYSFPGYFFDYDEPSLIVLSLLSETEVFLDGLPKMITLLQSKM